MGEWPGRDRAGAGSIFQEVGQFLGGFGFVAGDDRQPLGQVHPAAGCRVADLGQAVAGGPKIAQVTAGQFPQAGGRAGRQNQRLQGWPGPFKSGSRTGGSSSTRWALVPPNPNELTPARRF